MMALQGREAPNLDLLEGDLTPHSLGVLKREHLLAFSRSELVRATHVWRLNGETEAILRRTFTNGLFEYPASESAGGWVEDPLVYRDGELVFGIVSHESEGMLRLPEDEFSALEKELALVLHDRSEWI